MVLLCVSLSQTQDQFNDFLFNYEQLSSDITFCNPSFVLIAGDFNVETGKERIQQLLRALKLKHLLVLTD